MAGVTITYQGSTIASLTDSGQKTLLTAGKYCEANIGVDYTAPSSDISPVKDGLTRLYLDIPSDCDLTKLTIPLYWNQSVSAGVTIDWGDGSTPEAVAGTGNVNQSHTYAAGGRYIVTMTVASGCTVTLGNGASGTGLLGETGTSSNIYRSVLYALETGSGVTGFSAYCCQRYTGLKTVYFGEDIASIGNYCFNYGYGIGSLHFLGSLPANSSIGATSVWNNIPVWCKVYVPSAYIDASTGLPQNIPSRFPSTSTYTYAEEPNA